MSNLVNGRTSFTDIYALAEAVSKLLQDERILETFIQQIQVGGLEMQGYERGDKALVDFVVPLRHRKFSATFGHGYTPIGFKKQANGIIDVICEDPDRVARILLAGYTEEIIRPIAEAAALQCRRESNYEETVITLYR